MAGEAPCTPGSHTHRLCHTTSDTRVSCAKPPTKPPNPADQKPIRRQTAPQARLATASPTNRHQARPERPPGRAEPRRRRRQDRDPASSLTERPIGKPSGSAAPPRAQPGAQSRSSLPLRQSLTPPRVVSGVYLHGTCVPMAPPSSRSAPASPPLRARGNPRSHSRAGLPDPRVWLQHAAHPEGDDHQRPPPHAPGTRQAGHTPWRTVATRHGPARPTEAAGTPLRGLAGERPPASTPTASQGVLTPTTAAYQATGDPRHTSAGPASIAGRPSPRVKAAFGAASRLANARP